MSPRAVIVLLAAGLSRRFGPEDKLSSDLGGRPLAQHAAAVVRSTGYPVVLVHGDGQAWLADDLGGDVLLVHNPAPEAGMGRSIRLGVQAAIALEPASVVITLADMPFVPQALLEALIAAVVGDGHDAAHAGPAGRVRPPTAFGPGCFAALAALSGENGARSVLEGAGSSVRALDWAADDLADIDTPEALKSAHARLPDERSSE
ncbi:MAG: nucleotidyltransferase family protein [Hyphomonadaceae bacterium]